MKIRPTLDVITELPQTSFSTFVVIPETAERKRFCWIMDREDDTKKDGMWLKNSKKAPGGGVEPQETLEEAAKTEVVQEVGLRVIISEQILAIHKPSFRNPSRSHHNVFYASSPPLNGADLRFGEEILNGGWLKQEEIISEIKEGKFFPNHASAFLWYFMREEYTTSGEKSLLTPIFRMKRNELVSWEVEYGKLILCCNTRCEECLKETKDTIERQKPTIAGKVKYVVFHQTYFDDHIFLEPNTKWSYRLPQGFFKEGTTIEEVEKTAKDTLSQNLTYIGICPNGNGTLAVFRCENEKIAGFNQVCLNRYPDFHLPSYEDWADILEAGKYYNSFMDPKKKMVINHTWHARATSDFAKTRNQK